MAELVKFGAIALGIVFAAEALYVLFFRNFGLMPFRLTFNVPGVDADTVWSTYFDGQNAWNSVTERLSHEVLSDNPRIVRVRSRMRGTEDAPVTMDMRIDTRAQGRSCRATLIAANGASEPPETATYEVVELSPDENGTTVKIEAGIPVRGWLWVPVHRRNLERIFQDLRIACLQKAGVPFRVEPRLGWR